MIAVQCSECQRGEKFKTSAGKRKGETMTLIMVATSALNVKVMRTQARVNGESNHVSTSVDVAVWLESTIEQGFRW